MSNWIYRNFIFIILCSNLIVFKILKISPDQMPVSIDLRDLPVKQLNLNFSNNDVQWNPKDGKLWLPWCLHVVITDVFTESQLATAPTNGCVILWDINKRTKSKIGKCMHCTYVMLD